MLAIKMLDKESAKVLQRALNEKNVRPKLKVDGLPGKKTMLNFTDFNIDNGIFDSAHAIEKSFSLLGLNVELTLTPKTLSKEPAPKLDVSGKVIPLNRSNTKAGLARLKKSVAHLHPSMRILKIAENELGVLEVRGSKDNPRVRLYHAYSTVKNDKGMADSVAWCASAACFVIEIAGLKSTNSKMARSFGRSKAGYKNVTKNTLPGDLVVFFRNGMSSGSGHVGILVRETANYYYVMGGNQSDGFNIKRFPKKTSYKNGKASRGIIGVFRVHNEAISIEQRGELIEYGNTLAKLKNSGMGGSVV